MNGTVNRWRERWRLLRHWGNRWHRESIAGQLLAVSVLLLLLLLMMTKQRTVETIVALSAAAVRIQANNTPTTS